MFLQRTEGVFRSEGSGESDGKDGSEKGNMEGVPEVRGPLWVVSFAWCYRHAFTLELCLNAFYFGTMSHLVIQLALSWSCGPGRPCVYDTPVLAS